MLGLLFLLFTLVPALEIYLIVRVGGSIGAFNTFALLIFTGFLGAALARSQGRSLLVQVQAALSRGEVPAGAALHGLMILAGGLLLVMPGFFTDALGLLLILPGPRHVLAVALRKWFERQIRSGRLHVFSGGPFGGGASAGGGPFHRGTPWPENGPREERDVSPEVIDVTPVRKDVSKGRDPH